MTIALFHHGPARFEVVGFDTEDCPLWTRNVTDLGSALVVLIETIQKQQGSTNTGD